MPNEMGVVILYDSPVLKCGIVIGGGESTNRIGTYQGGIERKDDVLAWPMQSFFFALLQLILAPCQFTLTDSTEIIADLRDPHIRAAVLAFKELVEPPASKTRRGSTITACTWI